MEPTGCLNPNDFDVKLPTKHQTEQSTEHFGTKIYYFQKTFLLLLLHKSAFKKFRFCHKI